MNTNLKLIRSYLVPILYLALGIILCYFFLKKNFETKLDNNLIEFSHNQEALLVQKSFTDLEILININDKANEFGWHDGKTKDFFMLMLRNNLNLLTPDNITLLKELGVFNSNMHLVINKAKKIREGHEVNQ